MDRPLVLVLAFRCFDAFADGSKRVEWRRYSERFNERTCAIGRPVVLHRGYTLRRLVGRITSFDVRPATKAVAEIYGRDAWCAVIGINLDQLGGEDQRGVC